MPFVKGGHVKAGGEGVIEVKNKIIAVGYCPIKIKNKIVFFH